MKFNNLIKKIPTIVLLLFFILLTFLGADPSKSPDFLYWSWLRFMVIVFLSLVVVYLLVSLFKSRLISFNNYICYLALFVLIGLEIFLHFEPDTIPSQLLPYLPQETRKELARQRGIFTKDLLTGEGLFYHYIPNQQLSEHIKIDKNGYRNSVDVADQVNVVILGDSLISAERAEKDLGDLFRQNDYTAVNLAMAGYSPQHYSQAYDKYIIKKNISHDYVLTFLFIGNDIENSVQYEKALKNGIGYIEYLGEEKAKYYKFLPWTINLAKGLPVYFHNMLNKNQDAYIAVGLPYKTIKTFKYWWNPEIKESDLGWQYTKRAIDQISISAKEKGSTPIVFLIPSPPILYSEYEDYFKTYEQSYLEMVNLIKVHFQKNEVLFVDLAQPLQEKNNKNFLFLSDEQCHFSSFGTEQLFEIVLDYVEGLKLLRIIK